MHEDILAGLALDEAKTLGAVKPLYNSLFFQNSLLQFDSQLRLKPRRSLFQTVLLRSFVCYAAIDTLSRRCALRARGQLLNLESTLTSMLLQLPLQNDLLCVDPPHASRASVMAGLECICKQKMHIDKQVNIGILAGFGLCWMGSIPREGLYFKGPFMFNRWCKARGSGR